MATDSSLLNSELELQKQEELYQQLLLQVRSLLWGMQDISAPVLESADIWFLKFLLKKSFLCLVAAVCVLLAISSLFGHMTLKLHRLLSLGSIPSVQHSTDLLMVKMHFHHLLQVGTVALNLSRCQNRSNVGALSECERALTTAQELNPQSKCFIISVYSQQLIHQSTCSTKTLKKNPTLLLIHSLAE